MAQQTHMTSPANPQKSEIVLGSHLEIDRDFVQWERLTSPQQVGEVFQPYPSKDLSSDPVTAF